MSPDSPVCRDLRAIGAARAMRRVLLRTGRRRLGDPSPEMVDLLEMIEDLDDLETLIDRVADGQSWPKLMASLINNPLPRRRYTLD